VAESVLLKSQREPEEKKIPYMGHLLSSVAFDAEISANMAHQITKIAEQLNIASLIMPHI
jgi:K+-transporting ATPase c subunit